MNGAEGEAKPGIGRIDPAPLRYRPDIDGLRAIAVLPVLFFHVGVRGFSGGFVGVDVFFVISGYLITGILVRDIEAGRYSIAGFYRRRILRIFPALIGVMIATTAAACLLLLPVEFAAFARSLAATALFASNIDFYRVTSYFNPGGTSQPLLHTWSLAVEEQWYILWPLVLAAIGSGRIGRIRAVAIAITLVSFALSLWLLPVDPAATFYLLPTRAWELGLGATLAVLAVRPRAGLLNEALALIGLALIALSVKFYTADTAFPGLAAVPPCLGTALLLHSGRAPSWVGQLLSLAPLRFVGLISYSLYLWHWPIVVFADTGLLLPKTPLVIAAIILVSIGAATLSWWLVETPFRRHASAWRTSRVLGVGAALMLAMVALAAISPSISRAIAVYPPDQLAIARYLSFDGDGAFRRGTCFKVGPRGAYDAALCLRRSGQRPAILLVGDSYAAQLWPGLARYRDRFDILQATATGCLPKLTPHPRPGSCEALVDLALGARLAQEPPSALILAGRWQWASVGGIEATLRDPAVRAAHPLLVGPMPQYSTSLPRVMVIAARRGDPGLIARTTTDEPFEVDRYLKDVAARTGTPYFSMIDLLCTGRRCRTLAAPGVPIQFDTGHLTSAGSARVVDALLPRLTSLPGLNPRSTGPDRTAPPAAR